MKLFTAAVFTAAYSANTVHAVLGQPCVASVLAKLFNQINDSRSLGDKSRAYTDWKLVVADSTNYNLGKWVMRNNLNAAPVQKVNVIDGKPEMVKGTAIYTTDKLLYTGATPLKWSEGLAKGSDEFVTEWFDGGCTSVSLEGASSGSTTDSRAAEYTTITGAVTETAFFYEMLMPDFNDMMRMIISNDGASNDMRTYALKADSTYTAIGMAYKTASDPDVTSLSAIKLALDIVVAEGAANKSGVAACQPTGNFGGGTCDPDAETKLLYEALNDMRETPLNNVALLDLIAAAFTSSDTVATYAWDGVTATDRSFQNPKTNVGPKGQANSASKAVDTNKALLMPFLEWSSGLWQTAQTHNKYQMTLTGTSATGTGDIDLATQLAAYGKTGTGLVTQVLGQGIDTYANHINMALIDDLDSGRAARIALLSVDNKLAGVHYGANATTTKIWTILVADSFTTNAPYDACTTTTVAVVPVGALALGVTTATALAVSALF